ncbi:unnamed protein product [Heterotrigona itama]|uniref:Uncharacterized protein n=1 Tax=Heterotrigona itama TaxID=395501 RepID=A0A6V7H816_9HYME|nr:unnamed protein product [Heterotrigona itama]
MIEGGAAKSENWRIEWQRWVPEVLLLPFCGKPESSSRSSLRRQLHDNWQSVENNRQAARCGGGFRGRDEKMA